MAEAAFCIEKTLSSSEDSHLILSAGATETIVVKRVHVTMLSQPFWGFYVGNPSGSVQVLVVPPNLLDGQYNVDLGAGISLTQGKNLVIKTSSPGPSAHVVVEGVVQTI